MLSLSSENASETRATPAAMSTLNWRPSSPTSRKRKQSFSEDGLVPGGDRKCARLSLERPVTLKSSRSCPSTRGHGEVARGRRAVSHGAGRGQLGAATGQDRRDGISLAVLEATSAEGAKSSSRSQAPSSQLLIPKPAGNRETLHLSRASPERRNSGRPHR